MADVESDPEIQFNNRGAAGEGESRDVVDKEIQEDDDADSSYADSISRPSTPQPMLHRSEKRNNTRVRDRHARDVSGAEIQNMRGLQDQLDDDHTSRWKGPNLKPDTFTGEDDWESYITHFELCAELGRWSQREIALTLAASLRGQARTFYMTLNGRERFSYRALAEKLNQRFSGSNQQTVWLSRMESRRRQEGETVAAFGDDLAKLVQRAHPDLPEQAQDAIALNQPYKSVTAEMKYRCIMAECSKVSHAVEMIDTYDNIVQGEAEKKKAKVRMVSADDNDVIKKLQEVIQQLIGRIDQLEKGQSNYRRAPNYRRCYLCQSTDHLMRHCPRNQNQDSRRGNYHPVTSSTSCTSEKRKHQEN